MSNEIRDINDSRTARHTLASVEIIPFESGRGPSLLLCGVSPEQVNAAAQKALLCRARQQRLQRKEVHHAELQRLQRRLRVRATREEAVECAGFGWANRGVRPRYC